jgi:transposase
MLRSSSLTVEQRDKVIVLFEAGYGRSAAATLLGVSKNATRDLWDRWQIHGREALVTKKTKPTYSWEFKLEVVQKYLAGEMTSTQLAAAYGLSSRRRVKEWAQIYRDEGADGLRPKPKGRPARAPSSPPDGVDSELGRLRAENEMLRAKIAYLGKLRALRDQERQ